MKFANKINVSKYVTHIIHTHSKLIWQMTFGFDGFKHPITRVCLCVCAVCTRFVYVHMYCFRLILINEIYILNEWFWQHHHHQRWYEASV